VIEALRLFLRQGQNLARALRKSVKTAATTHTHAL
jgi:hypothetical protein